MLFSMHETKPNQIIVFEQIQENQIDKRNVNHARIESFPLIMRIEMFGRGNSNQNI